VLCQRLASYSGFEFLLMQVCCAISLRPEAMLKTFRPTGGKQLAKGSIRLKFPDEADLAANRDQPYLCAAYMHHCRSLMRRFVDTGIAIDKGSAHGLPLQTTVDATAAVNVGPSAAAVALAGGAAALTPAPWASGLASALATCAGALGSATTIAQAAAPHDSQMFLLYGAAVLIPLIPCYTAYAYWVFRGKVRLGDHYH
jgi:hypothetical protein